MLIVCAHIVQFFFDEHLHIKIRHQYLRWYATACLNLFWKKKFMKFCEICFVLGTEKQQLKKIKAISCMKSHLGLSIEKSNTNLEY